MAPLSNPTHTNPAPRPHATRWGDGAAAIAGRSRKRGARPGRDDDRRGLQRRAAAPAVRERAGASARSGGAQVRNISRR